MAKCPYCGAETGEPIRIPFHGEIPDVELILASSRSDAGSSFPGMQFARLLHGRSTSGFFEGLYSEMKRLQGESDDKEVGA